MKGSNSSRIVKVSFRQKIILTTVGFLLFIVLLEAGLRLGGFILLSLQEHRNLVSIKQKGTYRIMCLGESTTALGGEYSYPSQLENILNQNTIGIKFSVVNKGLGGDDTTDILKNLEGKLDRYNPDMVITMMGINDYGAHMPYEGPSNSKIVPLLRSFKVFKLTKLLWLHIVTKAKEKGINRSRRNENITIKSYIDQNKSIKTEDMLKKTIELNLNDYNKYIEAGVFYRDCDEFTEAEKILKKAIELNSNNDRAYRELAWTYYKNPDRALQTEEMLKKAIEANPGNAATYTELAEFYLNHGKILQAIEMSKKTIELTSNNVGAYHILGMVYSGLDKPQAVKMFKKAIDVDPDNYDGYIYLGIFFSNSQDTFNQSEEMFRKAIDLNPQYDYIYSLLAALYEKMGKHEYAVEYYEKADKLRLGYHNPVVRHNYQELKKILDKRKIKFVCMQYPMRKLEPLKKLFETTDGITFIDNEKVFKEAVKRASYKEYFTDIFASDFGHCTPKGNRLLAENTSNVILKECFEINSAF